MSEMLKDRVVIGLAVVLLGLVVLEATLIPHYNPVFPWHNIPGYAAFIGFVGSLVVVQTTKLLGRLFLQRPEE